MKSKSNLTTLMSPLSLALMGPVVDQVFEPAVLTPGWGAITPLVGARPGAGIGLLAVLAGVGVMLLTAVFYVLPSIRNMEHDLPDAVPAVTANLLEDMPAVQTA